MPEVAHKRKLNFTFLFSRLTTSPLQNIAVSGNLILTKKVPGTRVAGRQHLPLPAFNIG